MTPDQNLSARLAELRTKATDDPLHTSGRYFDDRRFDDLTACSHGDTGNFRNEHDGNMIAALWNAYRSGQLIAIADHSAAVQAAVADAKLEMINALKDEIARQEGQGGEGSSLWCVIDGERTIHEIRAQERMDARVQAAVAKAVEAEREECAEILDNVAADYEADAKRYRGGSNPHHYRRDKADDVSKYAAAIRSRGVAG